MALHSVEGKDMIPVTENWEEIPECCVIQLLK